MQSRRSSSHLRLSGAIAIEAIQQELQLQRQRVGLFAEVTLKIRQSLQLKEILWTTVTEVQRIFERFHQVDSSNSYKKGFTDLKLAIYRKVVEQHEGSIWVESPTGQGSTLSFTLLATLKQQESQG
jgi:light-regulated signal transduction histidine kinase (bacteriophytochrome)